MKMINATHVGMCLSQRDSHVVVRGKRVTPMNTNTGICKQKGKDRVVYAANMQVKRNADQWRARTALWRMLVVRVAVIFHGARLYETCEA